VSKLWLPRRHAAEALGIDRRTFIAAGGLLALAGCNAEGPKSARGLLRAAGCSATPQ
jgi:hypothetical protein